MKPTIARLIFVINILFIACDNPTYIPPGGNGADQYLSWIQTMSKVRVTYSGMTDLSSSLKQGSLDSGVSNDIWLPRGMEFRNTDSAYSLTWQDSEFSTHACFVYRQVDPSVTLSSDCGDGSSVRGVYHSGLRVISDLLCTFQKYNPGADINSYVAQTASLDAPLIELETFDNDSVSFTVKTWNPGAISLGYMYDERSYGTYSRQMQLVAYDTLGREYQQTCRVVFFKQ